MAVRGIIVIVVVCVALNLVDAWSVPVPSIGVVVIPIVTKVSVICGPIAAEADENVFSMVIRINVPKCESRAVIVVD